MPEADRSVLINNDCAVYQAALIRIKKQCGYVCDRYEVCDHISCESSYTAWAIADAALHGETVEEANKRAIAEFRSTRR